MQGVLAVRNYRRKMREEIRIQTVIATRRIDDRNSKGESVKERLRERENVTKKEKWRRSKGASKEGKGVCERGRTAL